MLGLFQSIVKHSQDSVQGITPSFCHWTTTDWSAFTAAAIGGKGCSGNCPDQCLSTNFLLSPSLTLPLSAPLHLPLYPPLLLPLLRSPFSRRPPALTFTLAWMVLRRGSIKQALPAQGGEERQDMYMLGWP